MEKIYFLEENYDDWLNEANMIDSGSEGHILSFGDEVIKVMKNKINLFTKYRLRKLSEMDVLKDTITMPTKEIYYDFNMIGFAMSYAGINLKELLIDLLKSGKLSDDVKLEYLYKVRNALINLHANGVIHGDIQPRNILVDSDNHLLIGDINNCNFGCYKSPYLNEITLRIYQKYGLSYIIDLQTFNYFSFFIMNADKSTLESILYLGGDAIWYYNFKDFDNKYFDSDVFDTQLKIFNGKENKKKALVMSDYLINHLK